MGILPFWTHPPILFHFLSGPDIRPIRSWTAELFNAIFVHPRFAKCLPVASGAFAISTAANKRQHEKKNPLDSVALH
jgi:hypothetical protein